MSAAAPLVLSNPLTGEILDPDDEPTLRKVQQSLEEWLGHNDVQRIPVWKASRLIRERLAGEPYKVPARSGQTDTQRKLERCPRCSGVLEVEKK